MEFRSKLKVQISIENLLFSVVSVFEGVTKTKVEIIPIKVSSDKSLCYYKFFEFLLIVSVLWPKLFVLPQFPLLSSRICYIDPKLGCV